MTVDPRSFFDSLAGDYHLMFPDWWAHATWQGGVLDRLLRAHGVPDAARLLDCTCGIGTQALPLARLGYRVTGTDLSPRAVERARAEAAARGIDVRLSVADVRVLDVGGSFDAVLSSDNSLPHLRTDDDLGAALTAIRARLVPGGVFVASVRDYDTLARDRVAGVMPTVHDDGGARRIVGQAWTWADEMRTVTFDLFMIEQIEGDGDDDWHTTVRTTANRAWRRSELTAAALAAGFQDVVWHSPEESGYYQPIVTCVNPRG